MLEYSNQCSVCDSPYSLDTFYNLQKEIDKAISGSANTYLSSEKNDLAVKVNTLSIKKLSWYYIILTNLIYCNGCYDTEEYSIDEIINLIKTEIIKSK